MRFASLCLCLCTLLASLVPPTLVQCSGPEVFTLRVLPGQQAVAIGDDQGRDLMESGRFSKYACTSLDGPDCGMVNGHSKLDIAQILASMLEMIGSSRKATADDPDQDATATSTSTKTATSSTSSSFTDTDTGTSSHRKQTQTDAQDEDGATTLTADQLSALQAALAKQLHELLGAHLSSDSDSDTVTDGTSGDEEGQGDSDSDGTNDADEPHIEMQIVDGEVDLSQVEQDGTSVHAFTIGADGETHAITPEELKQLLRAAQRMKHKLKGSTRDDGSETDTETQQQQQEQHEDDSTEKEGTHARSARPTRMTPEQMRHAREEPR